MSNPFETKKFKALEKKWYSKLKNDGFSDIERNDKRNLKTDPLENIFHFYDEAAFERKEEYYRLAGQFLHEHKFKSAADRLVWDLHSQGMSIRNIIKRLKLEGFSAYRDKVQGIIKNLLVEMKNNVTKR